MQHYRSREPVRRQASDSRLRSTHMVRRRAVDALACTFHVWCRCVSAIYHLRQMRAVHRQPGGDGTGRLVTALVLWRLDYCNAVLDDLPASTLAPLQRVLHAAARTVLDLKPRDRVTFPALQELRWLITSRR